MPLDPQKLKSLHIPDVAQRYTERDVILYALAIGLGQDPLDAHQLSFVTEPHLKVLPTFAVTLAFSPFWLRDLETGVTFGKVLHGAESLVLHRPLPVHGYVTGRMRITDVADKGVDKGAVLICEREILDEGTGDKLATLTETIFCRGDGGFGGRTGKSSPPHPIPARDPDAVCDLPTRPETALLYRLLGDRNSLHYDPAAARAVGFERPILHGLATFGVAGHALLRAFCDYEPERLHAMSARFTAPVYPGETVRTELWRDGDVVSFRARVTDRDRIVIDHGRAEVR
jgi:acyl dehydratase